MKIMVAVLAGGKSKRMGKDKAALAINGEPMLAHVCRAAQQAGLDVCVIGRHPDDEVMSAVRGVAAYRDEIPGIGPIGGLLTALRHTRGNSAVLLAACDLPLLGAPQFAWLANCASCNIDPSIKGLVPMWQDSPQPLFALYKTSLIPLIERQIEQSQFSLRAVIEKGDLLKIPLPQEHAPAVFDVDTREQFQSVVDSQIRNI